MKIKSLLLGSAAALIAASAAQAADAIVVEPEPVEYVRVCDAYGSGWFFIPGTETCLRISGYVRSTYIHDEQEFTDAAGATVAELNNSSWTVRGRLNIQANNETEYGTLASYLRLQGGDASAAADQNVGIDRALISLAGFRLGYSDSYYTTNHGYAAGGPATGGSIPDLYYNYDQAIFFDYTYAVDGLAITVGVQDTAATTDTLDWYAGLNWQTDFGTFAFTVLDDNTNNDEAYKISAIVPLGDSGWNVGAFYSWDDGASRYVSAYLDNGYDEAWGVQVWGAVADNLTVYGFYSESEADVTTGINGTAVGPHLAGVGAEAEAWLIGAAWTPVSGLTVNFEYGEEDISCTAACFAAVAGATDSDRESFLVRVTRSW